MYKRNIRKTVALLLSVLMVVNVNAGSKAAQEEEPEQAVQESATYQRFLVKYATDEGEDRGEALAPGLYLSETEEEMSQEAFEATLTGDVVYVQPDYMLELFAEGQPIQEPEQEIQVSDPAATIDSTIALIDGGVDTSHPAFADRILSPWNFVDDTEELYTEGDGLRAAHGTHLSGILAGNAPNANIMPLKAFDKGVGYTSDVIAAIQYAQENGASVVNCSWGTQEESPALLDVMEQSPLFFVCAAGNNRMNLDETPVYPACFALPNTISVTSMDAGGGLSYFSNYGSVVDICAPGRKVYSAFPEQEYGVLDGTSISAAYISAAAAALPENNKKEALLSQAVFSSALEGKVAQGRVIQTEASFMDMASQPEETFDDSLPASEEETMAAYASSPGIKIAAGEDTTYVLKADGSVWSWGGNANGSLGRGSFADDASLPGRVLGISNAVDIFAGPHYALAVVEEDGQKVVYGWGTNNGALGDGTTLNRCVPVRMLIGLRDNEYQIVCGEDMTFLLQNNRVFYCGTIAQSDEKHQYEELVVPSTFNDELYQNIFGGYYLIYLQKQDGSIWSYGKNKYFHDGVGDYIGDTPEGPTKPEKYTLENTGIENMKHLASSNFGFMGHTLITKENGTVYGIGDNANGQILLSDDSFLDAATQVTGLANITYAKTGSQFSAALDENGDVWTWGHDTAYLLGHPSEGNNGKRAAQKVEGLSHVVQLACGWSHTVALKEDGSVWTWGVGSSGQLGHTARSAPPQQVMNARYASVDVPLQEWEFEVDGDAEGFTVLENITSHEVAGGSMNLEVEAGKASVANETVSINADEAFALEVNLTNGCNADTLRVLWKKQGETGYHHQMETPLLKNLLTGQSYRFDLYQSVDWTGTVTGIKLEFDTSKAGAIKLNKIHTTIDLPDYMKARQALDSILIDYYGGAPDAVMGNIYLPKTANGIPITWETNSLYVLPNGQVLRPSLQEGDKKAVLTATVTVGSATLTRRFYLTVKAISEQYTGYAWDFNKAEDLDGWKAQKDLTNVSVHDGILTAHCSGTDAIFENNNVHFEADAVKYLVVRMKNRTPSKVIRFYWRNTEMTAHTEAASVMIQTMSPNVNAYQEFYFDMSRNANWTGTITNLRFDPTNGVGDIEIDYIDMILEGSQKQKDYDAFTRLTVGHPNGGYDSNTTTDVYLPEEYMGVPVEWTSSNPNFITDTGKVTRPEYGKNDAYVTLEARVGLTPYFKQFKLRVVAWDYATKFTWNFDPDEPREWFPARDLQEFEYELCGKDEWCIWGRTSGVDPILQNRSDRLYDADVIDTLRVTMSSDGGPFELYWQYPGDTSHSPDKKVVIDLPYGHGTYTVDLSANPAWHGMVRSLRIDPTKEGSVVFTIDQISLYDKDAPEEEKPVPPPDFDIMAVEKDLIQYEDKADAFVEYACNIGDYSLAKEFELKNNRLLLQSEELHQLPALMNVMRATAVDATVYENDINQYYAAKFMEFEALKESYQTTIGHSMTYFPDVFPEVDESIFHHPEGGYQLPPIVLEAEEATEPPVEKPNAMMEPPAILISDAEEQMANALLAPQTEDAAQPYMVREEAVAPASLEETETEATVLDTKAWHSLDIVSVKDTKITFDVTFPVDNQRGNLILLDDFSKPTPTYYVIQTLNGQDKYKVANGRYTISGLQPGSRYNIWMFWSENGITSGGSGKCMYRKATTAYNTPEVYADPIVGKHIIASFEAEDVGQVSSSTMTRFVERMDKVYEAFEDLTGSVPYSGEKITLQSTRADFSSDEEDGGESWTIINGYSGQRATFNKPFLRPTIRRLSSGDWGEVFFHEISHDFDEGKGWVFDEEVFADFKTIYALDKLSGENASVYRFNTKKYYNGDEYPRFFESGEGGWCYEDSFETNHEYHYRGMTYILMRIQNQIGWEPFERTFRYFSNYGLQPYWEIDQFNLFFTLLKDYSGVDVLGVNTLAEDQGAFCLSDDEREIIEDYFGGTIEYVDIAGRKTLALDTPEDVNLRAGEYRVYEFTPTITDDYTIFTSEFEDWDELQNDTVLEVYTDESLLNEHLIAFNDASGTNFFSSINIRMNKGQTYYIRLRTALPYDAVQCRIAIKQEWQRLSLNRKFNLDGQNYKMFQFTPSETKEYNIFTGDYGNVAPTDNYLQIFSDKGLTQKVAEAFSDNSGTASAIRTLNKNTTYYIKVGHPSLTKNVSCGIMIVEHRQQVKNLVLDQEQNITLWHGGYEIYHFEPRTSGKYTFSTRPSPGGDQGGASLELFADSALKHRISKDTGHWNGYASLTCTLTAGTDYYIKVYGVNYSPTHITLTARFDGGDQMVEFTKVTRTKSPDGRTKRHYYIFDDCHEFITERELVNNHNVDKNDITHNSPFVKYDLEPGIYTVFAYHNRQRTERDEPNGEQEYLPSNVTVHYDALWNPATETPARIRINKLGYDTEWNWTKVWADYSGLGIMNANVLAFADKPRYANHTDGFEDNGPYKPNSALRNGNTMVTPNLATYKNLGKDMPLDGGHPYYWLGDFMASGSVPAMKSEASAPVWVMMEFEVLDAPVTFQTLAYDKQEDVNVYNLGPASYRPDGNNKGMAPNAPIVEAEPLDFVIDNTMGNNSFYKFATNNIFGQGLEKKERFTTYSFPYDPNNCYTAADTASMEYSLTCPGYYPIGGELVEREWKLDKSHSWTDNFSNQALSEKYGIPLNAANPELPTTPPDSTSLVSMCEDLAEYAVKANDFGVTYKYTINVKNLSDETKTFAYRTNAQGHYLYKYTVENHNSRKSADQLISGYNGNNYIYRANGTDGINIEADLLRLAVPSGASATIELDMVLLTGCNYTMQNYFIVNPAPMDDVTYTTRPLD